MQPLYAPLRSVPDDDSGASGDDASGPDVLTRIAQADPADDADNLVVLREGAVLVVMNRYPYASGHLLVIPVRTVTAWDALTPEERAEMSEMSVRAMGWLREVMEPDGFNLGINQGAAAGAGVPEHLHLHVVPRWEGDTNFMVVAGETSVVPESLETTYSKLRAARAASRASPRSGYLWRHLPVGRPPFPESSWTLQPPPPLRPSKTRQRRSSPSPPSSADRSGCATSSGRSR